MGRPLSAGSALWPHPGPPSRLPRECPSPRAWLWGLGHLGAGPPRDCLWAGRVRSSRGLSPNAAPLPACLSATGATFTRKCCAPAVPRSRPEPASRPPPRLHRPATVTEELREGAFSLLYFVLLTTEDNKSSIFGREGSLGSAPGACDLPAPRGSTLSPLGRGVGRQKIYITNMLRQERKWSHIQNVQLKPEKAAPSMFIAA